MFCKWCGSGIQLTDKKCPACGRETPPMSDCGGFYNLKHSNDGTTGPATEKVIVKEVPHCAAVEKIDAKYAKERKAAKKHHAMTMLCFAAVLIAIICTAIIVVCASIRLDKVQEQIANIQIEQPIQPTESAVNGPVENQQGNHPGEAAPNNFVLDVTVANTENPTISTSSDFGDYAKSVQVKTEASQNEKGQVFEVSYILDGEEATINMNLAYGQDESENLTIGVKCKSDLTLFDNQDFTYEWQYRSSNETWIAAEEDMISRNAEDYICFSCNPDWINHISAMTQTVDVRCNIQVKNEAGDSMLFTVTTVGITLISDSTLETDNQQ